MAKVETPEEFAMKEQANAIIDACLGVKHDTRADGYQNMLTKYGTKQDSSTAILCLKLIQMTILYQ